MLSIPRQDPHTYSECGSQNWPCAQPVSKWDWNIFHLLSEV